MSRVGIIGGMAVVAHAPDLRRAPPRSGRAMLGRYAWLGRLADKARAAHAGTLGDYECYCELSMGFLDRAGIAQDEFDELIRNNVSDEQLVKYFDEHVSFDRREAANCYVLETVRDALDRQDAEEGRGHERGA